MNTINWEDELDYEKILEDETKKVAQDKADSEANINEVYDSQTKVANDAYGRAVDDTESQYTDLYQKNAVQKLINEQQVAESMANIGLTDSGLNRTQQTAVQLSYANQKGKLDINRQKALEELSATLASDIATIEQKRIADLDSNSKYWKGIAESNAQKRYETNFDSYTELWKAEIDAAANASKNSSKPSDSNKPTSITKLEYGTYAGMKNGSNGNVIYIDINGNEATMPKGSNPYTGYVNGDAKDENGNFDPSKVFSNGYQPNNYKGDELSAYNPETNAKYKDAPKTFTPHWRETPQTVWQTANSNCYVWVGPNNEYRRVEYSDKEKDWVYA